MFGWLARLGGSLGCGLRYLVTSSQLVVGGFGRMEFRIRERNARTLAHG